MYSNAGCRKFKANSEIVIETAIFQVMFERQTICCYKRKVYKHNTNLKKEKHGKIHKKNIEITDEAIFIVK